MNIFKFAPAYLKEVLGHLPTLVFKLIPWRQLMQDVVPALKKMGQEVSAEQLEYLNKKYKCLYFVKETDGLERALPQVQGELLLEFYFSQLAQEGEVYLDLSASHLQVSEQELLFSPNNLAVHFSTSFRTALRNLYNGFYHRQLQQFAQALEEIGLTSGLKSQQKNDLIQLFQSHFGQGDQTQQFFSLEQFNDSFFRIFQFLLKHEIKMSSSFLFLGISLITLYTSLDGGSYNVRKAFLRSDLNEIAPDN